MDFSLFINECQWYFESVIKNKAHVKIILKHFNFAILGVEYVRLINKPYLTFPSDIGPLKMDMVNINICLQWPMGCVCNP
jgi:hypothetical protein